MTQTTIQLDAVDAPLPPEAKQIDDGLDAFNNASADFSGVIPFACFARSGDQVVGGVLARRWGQNAELQQLWVDDARRGAGLGRRLTELFEAHARDAGCTQAFLETFSFQAPGFYEKLGYEVACEFAGFPDRVSKFVMRKAIG